MDGIFTYIYPQFKPNVGKCFVHRASGNHILSANSWPFSGWCLPSCKFMVHENSQTQKVGNMTWPQCLGRSGETSRKNGRRTSSVMSFIRKSHLSRFYTFRDWTIWVFFKNNGTPKSSILIGFSIINHPFWGTTIFGNTHMCINLRW